MSDPRPAHPGLYRIDREPPPLLGQRCTGCGRLTFPPNPYGCERCGGEADELVTEEIPGDGELAAFATGPTGVGQVCEITRQLRGEAGPRQHSEGRTGLAHMVGIGAVCVVHVLQRE